MALLTFIGLLLLVGIFLVRLKSRASKNLPPGPSPIFPLVGNIPQLVAYNATALYETFDKLVNDYGPLVFIQFGKVSQVIVQDLELAKEVLTSEQWVDRYFDEVIAERSFGKELGLIFTAGDVWREMRRFTVRTMREYGFGKQASMEVVILDEIETLTAAFEKASDDGISLSMRQFFTISILNVMWNMLAGYRFSHDDQKLKELISMVDETSKTNPVKADLTQAFPILWHVMKYFPKYTTRRKLIKNMQQFFFDAMNERRKLGNFKKEPKDFIDAFLCEIENHKENNNAESNFYTDEQLISVCFDLFIAGSETTSNTLEFAMLYMILNPEVQVKVQREIDQILGKSQATLSDRNKMPYVEATILETQRLANVLPIIFRGSNQVTKLKGYDIPKGSVAGINARSIHLSSKIWKDPLNFRPERFLDDDNNIINTNKILPFGLGKRFCIGESLAKASLFLYFTSTFQRFTFSASASHEIPSTEPDYGFSLSPKEYFVTVKSRISIVN